MKAAAFPVTRHAVLAPTRLAGLELRNRVAVAPMSRVSARGDGVPSERMVSYYASFAEGGFGLIFTDGTFTDLAHSRGYAHQPGLATHAQLAGWRDVADAVHREGVPIIAQLMHAGALSQLLTRTVAPSAVAPKGAKMSEYGGSGPFSMPREMSDADIETAILGFATAATNARAAGFDGVEIHGANGYLVDQFITEYTNRRTDRYGGDAAGRTQFAVDVIRSVRAAVGDDFVVGIRLSQTKVNDFDYRWSRTDAETIFSAIAGAGVDYLHVASEGRDWHETARIDGELTVTRLARDVTGLPVIANGGMHDPEQAARVMDDGDGDLIALARGAIANPDWPQRLRDGRELHSFEHEMISPSASVYNQDEWLARHRNGRPDGVEA